MDKIKKIDTHTCNYMQETKIAENLRRINTIYDHEQSLLAKYEDL